MKTRTSIEAADLYVLLQREFRRRQRTECNACFVQLPFRVDRQDDHAPNWEVVMPPQCSQDCGALLEELVTEYGQLYDLRTEGSRVY